MDRTKGIEMGVWIEWRRWMKVRGGKQGLINHPRVQKEKKKKKKKQALIVDRGVALLKFRYFLSRSPPSTIFHSNVLRHLDVWVRPYTHIHTASVHKSFHAFFFETLESRQMCHPFAAKMHDLRRYIMDLSRGLMHRSWRWSVRGLTDGWVFLVGSY